MVSCPSAVSPGEVHICFCTNNVDSTSKAFVKKKAALTLLRLYRKSPEIVQPQWVERIISLMDDPDMGVALSVTSLVMALAQDNLDMYKGSYVKAAARLKRITVDGECQPDYLYYKVPCPWIQVKLLRLLQYFPPAGRLKKDADFPVILANMPPTRRQPCPRDDTRGAPKDTQPCHGDE